VEEAVRPARDLKLQDSLSPMLAGQQLFRREACAWSRAPGSRLVRRD